MTDSLTVICDSREQKPYSFYGTDTIRDGLDTGDYTVKGFEDVFSVERKTLDDLANTLGRGRKRFIKEIERAQKMSRFVVVIEADYSDVNDYRDLKNCPNYYSEMHPNSILGTVEKWPKKYATLDFVWAGSRSGGKALTLDLLKKWAGEYEHLRQDY